VGVGANELRATLSRGVAGDTAVLFTATGTTTALVSLNACAPGGSGDPFTDPASPYAFYIPDPGNGKTIKQIQLYISSAGKANAPSPYQLRLSIQRGTFDGIVSGPVHTTANVFLRGNNSEAKMVTFTLATPIVGANGPSAKAVMMRLEALTNPDGAKLSFNTGVCSPGKSCKPPAGCNATEVSNPLPYPSGTFYRKSVGISVLGN
jgi:pectin methylesterase-like acyl-CoA thioesterase